MKTKLIGCASTMNEVNWLGIPEDTECEFLNFDLHANPNLLHDKLQEIINNSQEYELIILTYSRCSNVLMNLLSPKVPMLVPRSHDCIGVLLGSTKRRIEMLKENSAVYYFSQGWLDYGRTPYQEYLEYEKRYGPETARHLIDTLYGAYQNAILILTPGMRNIEAYRQKFKEIADFFGWQTAEIEGSMDILASLLKKKQNSDTVLIPPGVKISEDLLTSE